MIFLHPQTIQAIYKEYFLKKQFHNHWLYNCHFLTNKKKAMCKTWLENIKEVN